MLDQVFRVEIFVVLSLLFKSVGFLVRDELILRALVMTGIICDVAFYALQPIPIMPPILSSLVLIAINAAILAIVIRERTTATLSDREKRLFNAFNTLTPGQFRKLCRLGTHGVAPERMEILREGEVPDRLWYIEGNRFEIRKGRDLAEVDVPAFAGEIAYLTGRPASATVTLLPGTEYTVWSSAALREASRRNLALENALVARFSLDLARKVAGSMPIGRVGADPAA
jgi:hypothetical protein